MSGSRTGENWNTFSAACQVVLKRFHLLQTAVDEEWGGPNSRKKYNDVVEDLMMNIVEQWDAGNELMHESIDDFFLDVMENDFNCDLEGDDVVQPISKHMEKLFMECAEGNTRNAEELVAEYEKETGVPFGSDAASAQNVTTDSAATTEETEGDTEMTEASAMPGAAGPPDDDGWVTIAPTGKNKKRNKQ